MIEKPKPLDYRRQEPGIDWFWLVVFGILCGGGALVCLYAGDVIVWLD